MRYQIPQKNCRQKSPKFELYIKTSAPAADARRGYSERGLFLNLTHKMDARAIGEEVMKNHCAYCHGKFGLVQHRRAFKSFCSQKCVDHYKAWLRADVGKHKGFSDCLRSASLSVVPYALRP